MKELTADEKERNKVIKACGCFCHQPEVKARHIMACCQYSCEKPVLEGSGEKKE